jgi:glycolate oxidase FAD binding subunit
MGASSPVGTFGGAPARGGLPEDDIQGVRPALVVSPDTAEGVATVLREASAARAATVLRGGGTKIDWGCVPRTIDLVLDVSRLNRVLRHEHGDMTATVEGGARLADVNAALGQRAQWLPLDTAFSGATIGGTLAAADSGSLRHRFGTARDLVIGVTLATAEGELVKAGGQVVKNVAGYDLGKLMSGTSGSYAAVVSATFKLSPVPRASATLVATWSDALAAAEATGRIAASQLEPMAVDLHARFGAGAGTTSTIDLLLRFASTPRSIATQIDRAGELMAHASCRQVSGGEETACWHAATVLPWARAGAIVRLSWQSALVGPLLALLDSIAADERIGLELAGRAIVGAGVLRIAGTADAQRRVVERLREAAPLTGAVSVLRGEPELKQRVDVWGDLGSSMPTLRALKQAFDPEGILNAGRGPV